MKRKKVFEKIAELAIQKNITAEEVKEIHSKCYRQEDSEEGYTACMLDALPKKTVNDVKDDYEGWDE
jgi:hypothetical protein